MAGSVQTPSELSPPRPGHPAPAGSHRSAVDAPGEIVFELEEAGRFDLSSWWAHSFSVLKRNLETF